MARILEIRDRNGKLVYLTDERYRHISAHPEMQNSLQVIARTIKSPDKIETYSLDPSIRLFYTYHKSRKTKARYLRVVIKYVNGEGFVITAYFVVNI